MIVVKYTIDINTDAALAFVPSSTVQEVMQNIRIILTTPKYSVPGYLEFGVDMNYQHSPITLAKTMYAVAVNDALKAFEPRAHLENVAFKDAADDAQVGTLNPILEVTIDG